MPDPTIPASGDTPDPDPIATYTRLVAEASARLDAQLAHIRADYETGQITIRESVNDRITVMQDCRDRLRALRHEYLGEEEE